MKDLTAFLDPDLPIKLGEHTYSVKPPTLSVGLQLASITTAGAAAYMASQGKCPSCGRMGAVELADETREILEAVGNTPLGRISLGDSVYDQMIADGIPEAHIDKAALYALYYWVLGESAADQVMAATAAENKGGGPAAPKASRTGRSTASGRQTKTASSPTTSSRPT